MKVTINKSTKLDGKFVQAGEIEVTKEQKKVLEKGGFLNNISKDTSALTDMEAQKLIKRNEVLEKLVEDGGGDTSELTGEIETLKGEIETKDEEITTLKGEIKTLKSEAADLTAPKSK